MASDWLAIFIHSMHTQMKLAAEHTPKLRNVDGLIYNELSFNPSLTWARDQEGQRENIC